jgi:hypothetical protein
VITARNVPGKKPAEPRVGLARIVYLLTAERGCAEQARTSAPRSRAGRKQVAKPKAEDDREKRIPEERIEALKRRAEELCGGPYDRDRLLPKPNYGEQTDGKPN